MQNQTERVDVDMVAVNTLQVFAELCESTENIGRDVGNAINDFGVLRDATAYENTPEAQRSHFCEVLLLSYWDGMVQESTTCAPGTPRANHLKLLLSDFKKTRAKLPSNDIDVHLQFRRMGKEILRLCDYMTDALHGDDIRNRVVIDLFNEREIRRSEAEARLRWELQGDS